MATFVVVAIALIKPETFRDTGLTIEGLFKSLFFIPDDDPKAPLLRLGWTLNYEAYFYIIFASLFFLASLQRTLAICGLLGALMLIGVASQPDDYLAQYYTSMSFLGFCIGTLLAQAYVHGQIANWGARARQALAVLSIGLMVLFLSTPIAALGLAMWHVLLTTTALAIVVTALQFDIAGQLPKSAFWKHLGDTSYSLYLFHLFAVAATWLVIRKMAEPDTWFVYIVGIAAAMVVGTIAGLVAHHLIERPLLDMMRTRRARQPTANISLGRAR